MAAAPGSLLAFAFGSGVVGLLLALVLAGVAAFSDVLAVDDFLGSFLYCFLDFSRALTVECSDSDSLLPRKEDMSAVQR